MIWSAPPTLEDLMTLYGMTLAVVQSMEKTLAVALMVPTWDMEKARTDKQRRAVAERLWQMEFGRLRSRASATFRKETVVEQLEEIQRRRNYLVHTFFLHRDTNRDRRPRNLRSARGIGLAYRELQGHFGFFFQAAVKFLEISRRQDDVVKKKIQRLEKERSALAAMLKVVA